MGSYYEDPKQTSEAVTSDGWFKTDDIGEWDKNGRLKPIDRKTNLVKARNGEYIAIGKGSLLTSTPHSLPPYTPSHTRTRPPN